MHDSILSRRWRTRSSPTSTRRDGSMFSSVIKLWSSTHRNHPQNRHLKYNLCGFVVVCEILSSVMQVMHVGQLIVSHQSIFRPSTHPTFAGGDLRELELWDISRRYLILNYLTWGRMWPTSCGLYSCGGQSQRFFDKLPKLLKFYWRRRENSRSMFQNNFGILLLLRCLG